jgi:type IV secretion system protein VirD4
MNNTFRILAEGQLIPNDTRVSGINNNDLIIGPSGAGKTRGYVKPNLLQLNESCIVTDTKGSLYGEVGGLLKRHGFRVESIDFTDLDASTMGYNPLEFIRLDEKTGRYFTQDILTVCAALIPIEGHDPFWDMSARNYLACLISYVLEALPEREHTLEYVMALFNEMNRSGKEPSVFERLLEKLGAEDPESYAYSLYPSIKSQIVADKMYESIRAMISEKLAPLTFRSALGLYDRPKRVDFRSLGRQKTAVFLTVSDLDRSMDRLVNLFYTQALQTLCASADKDYPDHRLPVPVRLYLDDFATNTYIPDFDKIISVIRSREVSVSVILQSISQLEALYGAPKAATIMNNCDNCLYLGGQDVETARFISVKANKAMDTILNLPLEEAWLFTRGRTPQKVRKFDITTHARYRELPEAEVKGEQLEFAS